MTVLRSRVAPLLTRALRDTAGIARRRLYRGPGRLRRAPGARNGSQRVQPPSDAARPSQILLAGHGLPVRHSPTATDIRNGSGVPWHGRGHKFKSCTAHDFSKTCLAMRAKMRARRGAGSYFDWVLACRLRIAFIAVAPVSMTGRS